MAHAKSPEDWIPTLMEFAARGLDPARLSLVNLLEISGRIKREQEDSIAAVDPRAFVEQAIGHKPKGPVLAGEKFKGKQKSKASFGKKD